MAERLHLFASSFGCCHRPHGYQIDIAARLESISIVDACALAFAMSVPGERGVLAGVEPTRGTGHRAQATGHGPQGYGYAGTGTGAGHRNEYGHGPQACAWAWDPAGSANPASQKAEETYQNQ